MPHLLFVEGQSDEAALRALAGKLDVDLDAAGVTIVAMGGASAFSAHLDTALDIHGSDLRMSGLFDQGELADLLRGLSLLGTGSKLDVPGVEAMGFFVCVEDLEDELMRAVGEAGTQRIIEAAGEFGSFRSLQRQPAWRGKPTRDQLRRFFSSQSGRKERYAALMVNALSPERVPRPLQAVLEHALASVQE